MPVEGGFLCREDFSDPGSGWEVADEAYGSVGYRDGRYFVISLEDGTTTKGVANRSFDNLVIEVDAMQISAPPNDNNDYGVVCRVQPNGDAYYLLISGDGFYNIMKSENGDFEGLVGWTRSDAIQQGNATNQIRAVCDGSDLALFVNGQLLASASDSAFSEGDIALTATTYEEEPTEVHFDNLRVYVPTAMILPTAAPTPPPTATPTRIPPSPTPIPATPTRGPTEFDPIIFAQGLTAEVDPVFPSMTFPPGTTEVYAVWACRGMYPGLQLSNTWYHNDQEYGSSTVSWDREDERGRWWLSLSRQSGAPLPPGDYRLELYVGGRLLQSGTFVIQ